MTLDANIYYNTNLTIIQEEINELVTGDHRSEWNVKVVAAHYVAHRYTL